MRSGKGFWHNPIAYISQIKSLLQDRYEGGFPVLKEIIQNADDAKATHLYLGWSGGIANATHPLLKGPALFFVNDGKFKSSDARNITMMGLSSKSGESSIGKFGLGLKSIFHLCEAFFYLSSEDTEFQRSGISFPASDILNPWSGDDERKYHGNWDDFDENSKEKVKSHLSIFLKTNHWFCLWIPLRQHDHCQEINPIQKEYPGEETGPPKSIFLPDIEVKISNILPMLRHIRIVEAWYPDGPQERYMRWFCVTKKSGAISLQYIDQNPPVEWYMNGQITVESSDGTRNDLLFSGIENLFSEPVLSNLKRTSDWPTTPVPTDTGFDDKPEQVEPHSAVCYTCLPARKEKGELNVSWAVFLPLDHMYESIPCQDSHDYYLTLHGMFFLDPGRNKIELNLSIQDHKPNDARNLRLLWNSRLAQEGTLKLVLPSLNRFVHDLKLTNDRVKALTEALKKSCLISEYKKEVCNDFKWFYCLAESVGQWRLLKEDQRVFEIPSPPISDPKRHYDVFPRLKELSLESAVTLSAKPFLSKSYKKSTWPQEKLLRLLDIPIESVFSRQGRVHFLVQFLEQEKSNNGDITYVSQRLKEIAREAIKQVGVVQLNKYQKYFQNFLMFIPSDQLFSLKVDDLPLFDSVLKTFMDLELSFLVIPKSLEPETGCEARFSLQEAVKILECIGNPEEEWLASEHFHKLRFQLAMQVLEQTEAFKEDIFNNCFDYKLFRGKDFQKNEEVSLSIGELFSLNENKTLFIYLHGDDFRCAKAFQKALSNDRVVYIIRDIAKILFGDDQVTACNTKACIQTIVESKPSLASPENRLDLISELQGFNLLQDPEGFKNALRYLLHGKAENIHDDSILFVEGETQDVWGKLTMQALHLSDGLWRIISKSLVDRIPGHHWNTLKIEAINPVGVQLLLIDVGPENIDGTLFSSTEREIILRNIDQLDILRKMPIYEDLDGNLTSIDKPHTYLESGLILDQELLNKITVIRKKLNPVLAAKQKELLPIMDAKAGIQTALEQDAPEKFWLSIMNSLEMVGNYQNIEDFLKQKLKSTAWLPTIGDKSVPPNDVLFIKGLEDDISRIVSTCGGAFTDVLSLKEEVREHNAYNQVLTKSCFPTTKDAVEMLGEIMSDDPSYCIAKLDADDFELIEFLRIYRGVFQEASPEIMPAFKIVKGISKKVSEKICAENLLPKLFRPISKDRSTKILLYLSEKHEETSSHDFIKMFNWYLKATSNTHDIDSILPEIKLLNQLQKWKTPEKLCAEADGIGKTYLLDQDQKEIIQPNRVEADISITEQQALFLPGVTDSDEVRFRKGSIFLERYFRDWDGHIADEVIGGFLTLLGDYDGISKLAESYLERGNRTVRNTRELLEWKIISIPNGFHWPVVGADEDIHTIMSKQRFFIKIIDSERISVPNLLGQMFEVPVDSGSGNLIIGAKSKPIYIPGSGYRIQELAFRKINPENHSPTQLFKFLRNTADIILDRVYCQCIPNMDEFWNQLSHSEQLDIDIAQDLLLESGLFYLRQLGVHTHERIRIVLKKWDEARRLKVEETHLAESGRSPRMKTADKDLISVKTEFKQIIKEDIEVQKHLLGALRKKIADHYQYTVHSIPFELFQNADDAVIEFHRMLASNDNQLGPETKRFVIKWNHQHISFLHWGRPINQFKLGSFEEGRDLGFDRDLEKMLVMSSSDKSSGENNHVVTGKFGLGFKSVFLITDRPKVLSGRLGFEIVGGMIPYRLTNDDRLRQSLNQIVPNNRHGTIFELPTIEIKDSILNEMFLFFNKLAPILVAFAKKIKQIEFYPPTGNKEVISWSEEPVPKTKNVYVGLLQSYFDADKQRTFGMIIRTKKGSVLFLLGPRGFRRLNGEIPTIWVTAPTGEKADLGFAINGSFHLDVGRAQIARDSVYNEEIASSIGIEIGGSLLSLFDLSIENRNGFYNSLYFSKDATGYEIWESFWKLLYKSLTPIYDKQTSEAIRLASIILWGDSHQGAYRLFAERPVLPSALWSDYKVLTQLKKVKYTAKGILETEEVFSIIANWKEFQDRVKVGEIVSYSKIADKLIRIIGEKTWSYIDLIGFLSSTINENYEINPNQAEHLGTLINEEFFLKYQNDGEYHRGELHSLKEFLNNLKFLGDDCTYHPSEKLLISSDPKKNKDEYLRSLFAPADRILSKDYIEAGLSFFKACRKPYLAPAKEMAEWATNVVGEKKRYHALSYLLEGELGRQVAYLLKDSLKNTWLEDLENLLLIHEFSYNEKMVLLGLLGLHKEGDSPALPKPEINPVIILKNIYEWWISSQNEFISVYNRKIYPSGEPIILNYDQLKNNIEIRKKWLILFLMGAVQTIGLTTLEQHREFIIKCEREGWLDIFCDRTQSSDEWMRVLEEYLDKETEDIRFYQWMKQFVSIFQIGRWLPEYAESFLAVNHISQNFAMTSILAPRANPFFQGGGPDAPPINRTLGIGAHFVMRELVRTGVISNKNAHKHCYMPTSKIRHLFQYLGCQGLSEHSTNRWLTSNKIYSFVREALDEEKASFGFCFDIPFIVISENFHLQGRFFNTKLPNEEIGLDDEDDI